LRRFQPNGCHPERSPISGGARDLACIRNEDVELGSA
jgi:hypothetical protein